MVAAVLVAAAGIGLAGCGDRASGSDLTGVGPAVSFPLAQPVTLTVGVPESLLPASARPSWEVLQRRTNVTLRPVAIAGSSAAARGTRLAELAASGELPDLLAEGVAPIDFIRQREWLVNLLERPELTPNLHRLLAGHERFRQGTHGRLLAPGELYALGVFDESASPYLGAIAYRQDLFEARGLGAGTWQELLASLGALQSEFPGSTPFAATQRALLFRAPSWFRSGVDERGAAYYHPERREWRLGPLEREFEDYLRWFHRLAAEGLMAADSLDPRTAPGDLDLLRLLGSERAFVVPWSGRTGPALAGSRGYGGLTEDGNWDRTGAWMGPLRLPQNRGRRGWIGPRAWNAVSAGWAVTSTSPHAETAAAFLDLLLEEKVAGEVAAASGAPDRLDFALWLSGEGDSEHTPAARYFERHDVTTYLDDKAVVLEPWPAIATHSRNFVDALAGPLVEHIAAETGRFITGARPLTQLEAFREELRDRGAERLLNWLNLGRAR
ncbi:MAG: hypothetical protein OXC31_21935 [Spirochaetaceae bacterium]|nr:hypothetical protein [Spirochaetaceae bacterium]